MKPLKYMPCTIQKMSSYYIPLLRSFRHCIQCLGARAKIKFILTHHHPRRVLSCSNFILPRTSFRYRKYKLYVWITVPFWTFKEEADAKLLPTHLSWLVTQ